MLFIFSYAFFFHTFWILNSFFIRVATQPTKKSSQKIAISAWNSSHFATKLDRFYSDFPAIPAMESI